MYTKRWRRWTERWTISLSLPLSLVSSSSPRRRVVALSRVTSTTPSHPAPMASRAVGRSVGRAGRGVSLESRLVDRTIERWENRTIGALRARGTRTKGGAGVAVGRTNVRTSVVRTFERQTTGKMKIERSSDRRGSGEVMPNPTYYREYVVSTCYRLMGNGVGCVWGWTSSRDGVVVCS